LSSEREFVVILFWISHSSKPGKLFDLINSCVAVFVPPGTVVRGWLEEKTKQPDVWWLNCMIVQTYSTNEAGRGTVQTYSLHVNTVLLLLLHDAIRLDLFSE
jgi:hypothetical protein